MRGRMALGLAALGGLGLAVRRRRAGRDPTAAHVSETEAGYRAAGTRILVLGAGFGGLSTALALDRRLPADTDASILVVDRNNDLLFDPLLWTVAAGRANPSDVVVPIRAFQRRRRFHVLHAEIERVDLERREVVTSAGSRPYDILVIALGSVTALPDLPGLRDHALLFHSPADALQLRNHLIDAIEAAHQTSDPDERREWLTFVVGGGGDTGIELAATIRAYLDLGLLAAYPWLEDAPPRVVVVGRAERLVPMSRPRTSAAVRRLLEAEGVEVLTGVSIEGATERAVLTSAGEIPARTLFWAAGITAPPVARLIAAGHARNGALLVDERLRLPDRPEVSVVGDVAWAYEGGTRQPVPPTAQAAEHEGRYVGQAIAATLRGQAVPPFRFRPLGHLALLGGHTGVAEIGPLVLSGLPAWLIWHGYYLAHIPAWRNRLHLLSDWLLAGLTGWDTAQLRLRPPGAPLPRHLRAVPAAGAPAALAADPPPSR